MCDELSAEMCDVIKTGTYDAQDAWNAIPFNPQGGNVTFCQRANDSTRDSSRAATCPTDVQPLSVVDDGFTITIKVIAEGENDECGQAKSLACLKPEGTTSPTQPFGNATLYIKEIPILLGIDYTDVPLGQSPKPMRVRWSNDPYEHNMKVWNDDRTEVLYSLSLESIMMHELGHGAALGELRDKDPTLFGNFVMFGSADTVQEYHTSISAPEAYWLHHNQRSKQRVVRPGKPKREVGA